MDEPALRGGAFAVVAENFDKLPKPYRRYAMGQCGAARSRGRAVSASSCSADADTVGTDNVAADAEACMLMADAMEALGIPRGSYVIRVNNRKVLDGIESIGIDQRQAGPAADAYRAAGNR